MAKDPAVLFYTSDFISGTITMTDEQRGQYIMLLCLQHQKGFLTEKDMLKICKTYDEDIWCKFIKDGEKYYNERMKNEAEKRKKYSESRRNNRKKKDNEKEDTNNISKTYVNHMENENINDNSIIKKGIEDEFLKKKYEEYSGHLRKQTVYERIGMVIPKMQPTEILHCINEFIDTCYGEFTLKQTKYQVEQYFINWISKDGKKQEAINNQIRKLRDARKSTTASS